jgi:DNA adenine methylase
MAVSLGLRPTRALICDNNPHLINFYQQAGSGLTITLEMENDSSRYYAARQRFNMLLAANRVEGEELAMLFYYLNRTGYNGLCRFNSRGEYNVPFGKYNQINYRRSFEEYQPVLSKWEYVSTDFADLRLEPGDFVYCDPPYDVEFTRYTKDSFTWTDQVRLAEWLACHPGPVVASNQATPRIVQLYSDLGYQISYTSAPRRISCSGDRSPAREIIATKNIDSATRKRALSDSEPGDGFVIPPTAGRRAAIQTIHVPTAIRIRKAA